MPVATDSTPGVAVSKLKRAALHETPLPDTPRSTKKSRKTQASQSLDAPIPGSSKSVQSPSWTWRSLTVSASGNVPLSLTKDGSYFFSANGPSIKIYSISTGRVISTLHPPQHTPTSGAEFGTTATVSCMSLNPHNSYQLITGSLDGLLRVWDFVDAVLLMAIDVGRPIHHLALHERFRDEAFVSVARPGKRVNSRGNPIANADNNAVIRVSLKVTSTQDVQRPSESHTIGKTRGTSGLEFSPSGSWLVATAGHKAYVASTSDLKAGFTKFVSPDKLTCLTFHPSEEYFATGDEKGVVRLWYCLNDNISQGSTGTEKKAPTTTLHWHAHAVSSLAFTANGAYLLTGGEEAVLVIWQLHTGRKEFVPRLGAPIASIAVSRPKDGEEEYLVGLADASFVFVRSGTLKISRSIARIKIDPAISNNRPTSPAAVPLAVHFPSSTIVLPSSHPSMIQMYAPFTADLISELEVSPSNKVSRRDEKPLSPPRVERATVSGSGRWMATVDGRSGDQTHRGEVYLKLWSWDRKGGYWILNTRIDRPHGLKAVTAVTFRPGKESASQQLVTTGADGTIKIWRLRQVVKAGKVSEEFWVAQVTLSFRSETPTDASWSMDGSLLAVSLGPYIGLYDSNTNVLISALTCPECALVVSAQFVGRSSRYLAAYGPRDLVLWDIVTQSVRWRYRSTYAITRLASRNDLDSFILFEQPSTSSPTTKVNAFTSSSSTPVMTQSLPFHLLGVTTCPSDWSQFGKAGSLGLVAVTHSWNIVVLGENIKLPEEGTIPSALRAASTEVKRTLFEDIFGVSAFASNIPVQLEPRTHSTEMSTWKGKDVEKIFDAPAYLRPPLDTLFDPLIQSFLVERAPVSRADTDAKEAGEAADDPMDVDIKSEPILVGNRLERTVGRDEMAAMISLFMSHAINTTKPTLNGVRKASSRPNGTTSPASAPTTKTTKIPPFRISDSAEPVITALRTPSPAASSNARAGQKRKKSLG